MDPTATALFFHCLIGDHHQITIIHKLLHHLEPAEQVRMHIWPSIKVRDSFKVAYLNNLQWNLHRMKRDTHRNSQPLLNRSGHDDHHDATSTWAWARVFSRDVFWILTCCFCFGVCEDVEDLI